MKKNISVYLLFMGTAIIFYWGLWNTYFQQDEWFLFGRAIYQSQNIPYSFLDFASKHFWPAGNALWFFLYKTLGFNASLYAVLSLTLHSFVAFLLWKFFTGFTNNERVSFLLAFLFCISYPGTQPVVWFAVPFFLLPAIIFTLLFLIYLQRKNYNKLLKTRDFFILFGLYTLGFLFREETMSLILLFPFYILLFWKGSKKQIIKPGLILIIAMVSLVIGRIVLENFIGEKVVFEQGSQKKIVAYNIFSIPEKLIVQNMFEFDNLYPLSVKYTDVAFPWLVGDGETISKAVFELLVLYIFLPVVLLTGYALAKGTNNDKKIMFFSVVWIVSYAGLLALGSRRLQFLESRYVYFGDVGTLLFMYSIFHPFIKSSPSKFKSYAKAITIILFVFFTVYFYLGVRWRVQGIYAPKSQERKQIISQILKAHPTIPKIAVLFVECKTKPYCANLPNDHVIDFQSGAGHMLMVLYGSQNERNYAPFFKGFYLWDWEAQGYKEIDGYGFGFYRDRATLLKALRSGKFLVSDIFAFDYYKKSNKIQESTKRVRKELYDELSKKRKLL